MTKLKTLGLIGASALALTATAATAQPYYGQHYGYTGGYTHRYNDSRLTTSYVDSLEWKINNAAREGRISWGEAHALLAQFRQVQPLAWRVQTGQANDWEYRRLSNTVARIEQAVNSSRYGYNNRYNYNRYNDNGYNRGY